MGGSLCQTDRVTKHPLVKDIFDVMITPMELRHLKAALRSNDSTDMLTRLAVGVEESDLIRIREQKLLFAPSSLDVQRRVAEAYLAAARRTVTTPVVEELERYVTFTSVAIRHFQLLSARMTQAIGFLGEQRRHEQLLLFTDLAEELVGNLQKSKADALKRNVDQKDVRDVETSEFLLHEYHGLQNDIWWALLRALNEVFRRTSGENKIRATKKGRARARQEFVNLFCLSLEWNNFEYLVDKLSFGEWTLDKLELEAKPQFYFGIRDVTYERAKLMGIRRSVSDRTRILMHGKRTSPPLEILALECAEKSVAFWRTTNGLPDKGSKQAQRLNEVARVIAGAFSHEDEKLFGATGAGWETQLPYLVGAMLAASMMGAELAAVNAGGHSARKFREHGLPLSYFREIAAQQGWPGAMFDRVLGESVVVLPTTGYTSIMRTPYILLDGKIKPVGSLFNLGWTEQVRARLLKGGATGRLLGQLWEDMCANLFREFGWKIVGQGLKLRRAGKTLGDIDILAAKDSLLLVIQCKAIAIPGDSVYDHWLARSKVVEGAEQALVACEFLKTESAPFQNLLHAAKLSVKSMLIQPLVITSTRAFTGWKPEGVPVSYEGAIRSVLRGAKVKFTTGDGTAVGEESHISGAAPNTEEFVQLLARPLDWRLASRSEKFRTRNVETESYIVFMPELESPIEERAMLMSRSVSFQG